MIKNKGFLFILGLVFFLVYFNGCETTIDPEEHLSLMGRVQFTYSDISTPDNVFIWVEGLQNLNTYTDINGNFKFQLDGLQRGTQGKLITGSFPYYYFLGNYQLGKGYLPIEAGEFKWNSSTHGIDENGNLTPRIMYKLLNISTSIQPEVVDENYIGDFEITVTLESFNDTISVILDTYRNADGSWASIIFYNPQESISEAVLYRDTLSTVRGDTILNLVEKRFIIHSNDINISSGNYEIIPFLNIRQDDFPAELMNNFGENADSFHYEYLNLHFKRETGNLTVSE